jgi:acyl dehydratase
MTGPFSTFSIIAANLPEHARNAIHTDAGAQAAGFPRALVAGVTTYAYLTHPIVVAWGLDWLRAGTAEVRFRSPVFDGDALDCVPVVDGEAVRVEARVGDDRPRAAIDATLGPVAVPPMRAGEPLRERTVRLDGELGSDYGWRAGDELSTYRDAGIVHPAVWPAVANAVVHADVARGAWIHTRSIVRHHGLARAGTTATVRSAVVRRFESHGERAILDVQILVDDVIIASLEHEAIVALPSA